MTTYRDDSFLKNAKPRDSIFLGMNYLPGLTPHSTDQTYIIEPAFDQRPDLLSHKLYGTSRLWWIFPLRNPDEIIDPIRDFTTGKEIIIPSKDRLSDLMS